MRGTISHGHPWEVMPDLYRDLEGIEKEEQASAEKTDQGGIAGRLDQFLSSLMLSLR